MFIRVFFVILLLCEALAIRIMASPQFDKMSTTELEERLEMIDLDLNQLARYAFNNGVGTNGSSTSIRRENEHTEWFEVALGAKSRIDTIIIVPHLIRDGVSGILADGFPQEFHILAGSDEDPTGRIIASYKHLDSSQKHIAPIVLDTPGVTASWIRIVATKLGRRTWSEYYNFQLAEILIFRDNENLALEKKTESSSKNKALTASLHNDYIVDGFMPYRMDAVGSKKSKAYYSYGSDTQEPPSITFDLERVYTLDQIHIHSLELSDNIPQATHFHYGTPRNLLVEGSLQADFRERTTLLEFKSKNSYSIGPLIMRRLIETPVQYVRLTILEDDLYTLEKTPSKHFGFAEVELLSQGKNVAHEATSIINGHAVAEGRDQNSINDGYNIYGRILPTREWLEELALRFELERERPLVNAELKARYGKQKAKLKLLRWLSLLLVVGIIIIFLINRYIRRRQITMMKERFAADLHDELGANLHAIGLFGDVALASANSPERLNKALTQARELTQRTSSAIRHYSDLQSEGLTGSLQESLQRTSARILVNIDYTFSSIGEQFHETLTPRLKMDILLFHKEALINIVRHAAASQVHMELIGTPDTFKFIICDNGCGLPTTLPGGTPVALKRRAKLMKASISVNRTEDWSTIITLTRKNKSYLFWK